MTRSLPRALPRYSTRIARPPATPSPSARLICRWASNALPKSLSVGRSNDSSTTRPPAKAPPSNCAAPRPPTRLRLRITAPRAGSGARLRGCPPGAPAPPPPPPRPGLAAVRARAAAAPPRSVANSPAHRLRPRHSIAPAPVHVARRCWPPPPADVPASPALAAGRSALPVRGRADRPAIRAVAGSRPAPRPDSAARAATRPDKAPSRAQTPPAPPASAVPGASGAGSAAGRATGAHAMATPANAEGSSAASDHQARADTCFLAAGRAQPGPQARLIQSLAQALQRLEAGGLHLQGHIAALRAELQLVHAQLLSQQRRSGLAQQAQQALIPALA